VLPRDHKEYEYAEFIDYIKAIEQCKREDEETELLGKLAMRFSVLKAIA
jgi:hypothetical protein